MYGCFHVTAPQYPMNSCAQSAEVGLRASALMRSANQRKLIVPRYRLDSFDRRSFRYCGSVDLEFAAGSL